MSHELRRIYVVHDEQGRILALAPIVEEQVNERVRIGYRPVPSPHQKVTEIELTDEHAGLAAHELLDLGWPFIRRQANRSCVVQQGERQSLTPVKIKEHNSFRAGCRRTKVIGVISSSTATTRVQQWGVVLTSPVPLTEVFNDRGIPANLHGPTTKNACRTAWCHTGTRRAGYASDPFTFAGVVLPSGIGTMQHVPCGDFVSSRPDTSSVV